MLRVSATPAGGGHISWANAAAVALLGSPDTSGLPALDRCTVGGIPLAHALAGDLLPHLTPAGLVQIDRPPGPPVTVRVGRHGAGAPHTPGQASETWVILDPHAEGSASYRTQQAHRVALEAEVEARAVRAEAATRELRTLALAAVHAEEQERIRIARLLHDGLQQLLVAAKIHASRVPGLDDADKRTATARTLVQLVDQSIEASRELTEELGSTTLTHGDLPAGLHRLARWLERHHRLHVELELDPHTDRPNPDLARLLLRAARELLFNVTKHAGVETATLRLQRTVRDGVQSWCLEVCDDGDGGASLQSQSRGGTGLGLGDLARRVTLVGGALVLDSPPGGGTRAEVCLPWEGAETEAGPDAPPADTITLVLVDDHDLVRQSIAAAISEEPDLQVVGEAADADQALSVIGTLAPQVVVMDVDLPGMSGIELTRRLRHGGHPSRVLGLSMHDDPSVAEAMRAAGALDFLSKGGPMDDLIAAIRAAAAPT